MTLFGALFTAAIAWALGRLLFSRLGIRLKHFEHELLAGVTGASLLSLTVFILCTLHMARTPVFLAFGVFLFFGGGSVARGHLPPLPRAWLVLFAALFAFYALLYLSNSLAPEISPDGSAYHLAFVSRYFRLHGFEKLTSNMYGDLSQGAEMLFLFAFAFGRHAAAATVHCLFLMVLPLLMLTYARRAGHPIAGACAALFVYLSPVAGIDGVSAYNDVALATAGFAMFYLLEIWREGKDQDGARDALLWPAALLAGFCFAIKYTGVVALLYAALVIGAKRPRTRWKAWGGAAICVSLMIAPWLAKNWIWTGNPLAPFFNRAFPNPYIHVSFEHAYTQYFRTYGLPSLKPLFWIVTVSGKLGGQIGPLFLLAPLGLLSARSRVGRHCLLACLFFLIPYPQNIGARFLIPALPYAALAIALAIGFSPRLAAALAIAAAILAWPRVIDRYRAPAGGWQISTMPWQAALHLIPPETYLARRSSDYVLAQTINRYVPENKRLWSTIPIAEAYTKPEILVFYYSAESETIQDILLTGAMEERQPLWNLRFTFPARTLTHLRLVQTATSADDIWSIGEARFFRGEREVEPVRADATPYPWDIGLALDRNPVTRWRSWESIHPGMRVDVDFAMPVEVDRVELHCAHDQWKIDVHPDGFEAKLEKLELQPPGDLRRLAIQTIKSRGIDYLLIGRDYPIAADMRNDPARWGLKLVAERGANRLYQIQ